MFGGWAGVLEESGCERVRLGGGELTCTTRTQPWLKLTTEARRHGEKQKPITKGTKEDEGQLPEMPKFPKNPK